jgi:hypothetical protein
LPVVGLSAAALSSAAVWLGVRRWRRRRATKLPPGWLPAPPPPWVQERAAEALDVAEAPADRLDSALRHLGLNLARRPQGEVPVPAAAIVCPNDDVEVILDRHDPGPPPRPWREVGPNKWRLAADQGVDVPAAEQRTPAPCPALVTVGDSPAGAVLANLECFGGAQLDGPSRAGAWLCRRWALELSGAPWAAGVRVLVPESLGVSGAPRVDCVAPGTMAARCQAAADFGAAAAGAAGEPHPQARLAGRLGDELVVSLHPDADPPPACPGLVVVGPGSCRLRIDLVGHQVELPGLGTVRLPEPDDPEVVAALAAGCAEAEAPPSQTLAGASDVSIEGNGAKGPQSGSVTPRRRPDECGMPPDRSAGPPRALPGLGPRVTVLGSVGVAGVGDPPRTQLVEMAGLLALRQDGWSLASFTQVIWRDRRGVDQPPPPAKTVRTRLSELRRWLGGPDTVVAEGDQLRLGPGVEVDWWHFIALSAKPDTMGAALALVRGRPLVGVLDGWAERDYWTSAIEARVVGVAVAAGEAALRRGDWEGALADCEIGLRLCPYDQRLTRVAMRAAAGRNDLELVHAFVVRAEAELDHDEPLDPETLDLLRALTGGAS